MYVILILFFASLSGIVWMLGRKLELFADEAGFHSEEVLFEVPFLKEVKNITVTGIKKHGYSGLVGTIRLYMRSSNFVKDRYEKAKVSIKNKTNKQGHLMERQEISKFLKVVSDYKHKIREIKHKIKEEEKI